MSNSSLVNSLDALVQWRRALDLEVAAFGNQTASADLLDESDQSLILMLRERLASEKLVLAFVGEFSRGKSELINAVFFGDTGKRVLPATPGRTTMCPVEMRYEVGRQARLSLLPIATRLQGLSLADLRPREAHWEHVALDPSNADSLVQALKVVTRTQKVSVEQATGLGFWNPSQPQDNPHLSDDGSVEVPYWRHAIINYPHPLLQRGLVVIDTPGLNAIGAEPELTLGLLPTAHAVVFVLAADTGVTKSDWVMWRDHIAHQGLERFVVLNKIDALADPMLSSAEVNAQIEQQRQSVAKTLGVEPERVYPVSARAALAARVDGKIEQLQASRMLVFEQALAAQLMPRRQLHLLQSAEAVFEQLRLKALRQLTDRRREMAEQLLELKGLRGKSGTKVQMMLTRVDAELGDFERCLTKLQALHAVHTRQREMMLAPLASQHLLAELASMQSAMAMRLFNLGARSAFETSMRRLRTALTRTEAHADEMRQMLDGSYRQLNAEFGFAFVMNPPPRAQSFLAELDLIENGYGKYLGVSQAWRKAAPGFAEQFKRMLHSKLRVVFDNAAAEFGLWSKGAQAQMEAQLRERRRGFARRRDALQRVQMATSELEQRIAEVQGQDEQLSAAYRRVSEVAARAVALAAAGPRQVMGAALVSAPALVRSAAERPPRAA